MLDQQYLRASRTGYLSLVPISGRYSDTLTRWWHRWAKKPKKWSWILSRAKEALRAFWKSWWQKRQISSLTSNTWPKPSITWRSKSTAVREPPFSTRTTSFHYGTSSRALLKLRVPLSNRSKTVFPWQPTSLSRSRRAIQISLLIFSRTQKAKANKTSLLVQKNTGLSLL